MLRIKSKVYSMDFFGISSVVCNNFRINRIGSASEHHETRKKIDDEKRHYQTGELIIDIPNGIKTVEKAKEYSFDLHFKLRLLLALSHGHDVPISEFKIYDVTNMGEKEIGNEFHSMWLGTSGSSSFYVRPRDFNQFLQSTMPLLNDEKYVSKTGVKTALSYYNSGIANFFLE